MILGVLTEILQFKKLTAPKHLTQKQEQHIDGPLFETTAFIQFFYSQLLHTIWQCGIHIPNGWCFVMHGAFVFRKETCNLRGVLVQIIINLVAFVTFLALNKAADHSHAIGQEYVSL